MTSFLKRRSLSKPEQGAKIHPYDLGFVRTRNKNKAHSLLLELFDQSHLSKADLARMLNKQPEQITRWLAGPSNLTLDTLSDLIFALAGEFYGIQCKDELSRGKSNWQSPEWFQPAVEGLKWKPIPVPFDEAEIERSEAEKPQYRIRLSSSGAKKEDQYERYKANSEETCTQVQ